MAGAELELPPNAVAEQESGQEPTIKEEEGEKAADKQEDNEDDEESTYEAEENDDSDHTQVPEDDEHTEVADEALIENAPGGDAGKEGQEEENGQEAAAGEEAVNVEEETKAATVLQSNFRGHKERKRLQEEGKIPAKKQKEKSPTGEEEVPEVQTPAEETCSEETEKAKESTEAQDAADVSSSDVKSEDQDETKAAVVLQSNFRGHKERKRLEEEGKIPKKRKNEKEVTLEPPKEEEEQVTQTAESAPESQTDASAENPEGLDEEKAATVLQSNFRGHRDRKKLKADREMQKKAKEEAADDAGEETKEEAAEEGLDVTDVVIEHKEETDAEKERLEEEQAAVKIQSNFRGYKDRKNLKANKQTAQTEAAQVESFTKEVNTFYFVSNESPLHLIPFPPCSHIVFVKISSTDHKDFSGLSGPAAEVE